MGSCHEGCLTKQEAEEQEGGIFVNIEAADQPEDRQTGHALEQQGAVAPSEEAAYDEHPAQSSRHDEGPVGKEVVWQKLAQPLTENERDDAGEKP